MPNICLEHPDRRVYRTGDEMPVTEEHGHAGSDLARPGFLMVCRGKVVRVAPDRPHQYRWRATCGATGRWQTGMTGIDAGLLRHVAACSRVPECDDAGMERSHIR